MTPATRTTVLLGVLLAVLLVAAYAVVSFVGESADPGRSRLLGAAGVDPQPFPSVGTPTPPPDTPRSGAGYPVRNVGRLMADRSVLVNGRGNADLRYRRAPGNGTRLHFICTGCGRDTWLVEQPRGNPVGGGPLADPADVTWAVDTVALGDRTSLLVKAASDARWTVTLTPFDAVPCTR